MDTNKIFEYVSIRSRYDTNFYNSIQKAYKRNTRHSMFIVRIAINLISILVKPKKKSVKYFFVGNKFSEIIIGLPKSDVCVIGGPRHLLFSIRHNIKFIPCLRMWNVLRLGLESSSNYNLTRLEELIDKLAIQIRKLSSIKSVLVVDNDSLPMQRSVITAARQANLDEVVCIQHGIFQSKSPRDILDGWFSDRFFAMNDIQKQLLIDKGMNAEKIVVMGFHSSTYNPNRPFSSREERKVCFLGQPWVKYGDKQGQRYFEIVRLLSNLLSKNGYVVYYKPHPWEDDFSFLNTHFNKVYKGTLNEALEEFDVFISLTSTALLEVANSGRIAIQVYDDVFETDDMSIYNNIFSVHSSSNDIIKEIIMIIKKEHTGGINLQPPVAERFLNSLGWNSEK